MRRLGRYLRSYFSGKHAKTLDASDEMIVQVEEQFGFDSGIRYFAISPWNESDGYFVKRLYWIWDGTVYLPEKGPKSKALREFVLHELGHAIYANFNLRGYLSPFLKKWPRNDDQYNEWSTSASEYVRSRGYVSGYAKCCREEDFCETLSAYLCNRTTWQHYLVFDGERFSSRTDSSLLQKLRAIHSLLGDLHLFE